MVSLKTLVTNLRSALQQSYSAWTLINAQLSPQQVLSRTAYVKALTELKDALAITFADRKLASYFKETIKTKYPHLLTLCTGYKHEVEKLGSWLQLHHEVSLRNTIMQQKKLMEQLADDARKSAPAMFNNLSALEGLVREAKKEGIALPKEQVEVAPGLWLEFLEVLEQHILQAGSKNTWLSRLGSGATGLAREAKIIEKRSREGWPTIVLHAKQSLTLQSRLLTQQLNAKKQVEEAIQCLATFREYTERLADLQGMGEEGFILAHADDTAAMEISNCLDTASVGNSTTQLWERFQRMKTHESHLTAVAETLLQWTIEFAMMEKQVELDDKEHNTSITSKQCDTMHDACTCIRRAATLVQQWAQALSSDKDATEGLLDSIYTDAHMRNLMSQSNLLVTEAQRTYVQA